MLLMNVFFLMLFIQHSNGIFGNSVKKLREKASKIYKTKFGKDKKWHFLGLNAEEYPGNNLKYLEINKEKWNEYYRCLETQNNNLGKYLSITPEAVLGFQGNNVKLECKVCLSPTERDEKIESVEWVWAQQFNQIFDLIEITDHVFISNEDKTLNLYDLKLEHTGQYMCQLGDALTAPYYLTVVNYSEEEFEEVHEVDEPHPKQFQKIEGYDLILDTIWTDWSICSTCDATGKKHRIGYCVVFENVQKSEVLELTPLLSNNENNNNSKTQSEITKIDLESITIFQYGIPCQSHILPPTIKGLPQVSERKNEIMTGYCKVKCPKNELFQVRNKQGKIIETANNSAGIYSLMQGLPPLEPQVERTLIYAVKGKTVVVSCPGSLNNDAPIQWQIGNKNVIPEIISSESNGRIFVSITDRIHIKNAKISDSNLYSCWQQNALAGTVRLVVEKKLELNFTKYLMIFGIIIILGVFLKVFIKAFFGRKYARI